MLLRRLILVLLVLGVSGAAIFWILTVPQSVASYTLPPHNPNLTNGEAMFNAGGCSGCHADEKVDRLRLSGGRVLKSPFGDFYVPNISPHPTDGIGAWTEAQFVSALLKGTAPDGRHYYPAFPYAAYQGMRINDVRDMFAYIRTLPAVAGRVRDHDLPFPFNIRRSLGIWKLLYLDGQSYRPNPSQSEDWNRGAYLVNALAHCAECHSPRNALGAIVERLRFAGGPNPSGQGGVPNITQAKLATWSVEDFANLLEIGETPNFESVGADMRLVIGNTSKLSAADRTAMAVYLKSLPAVEVSR